MNDMTEAEKLNHQANLAVSRVTNYGAIESVFTKADKILTNKPIDFKLRRLDRSPQIAFTDGKSVTINVLEMERKLGRFLDKLPDFDDEVLELILGLNYHEVAHILFSPRTKSVVFKTCIDNHMLPSLQFLEDIRIENMIIKKYPSIAPFLEYTICKVLLKEFNGKVFSWAHTLARVYGAKYLSLELRQELVDTAVANLNKDQVEDIIDIVNHYQKITYPTQGQIALKLIQRFSKYFDQQQNNNGEILNEHNACDSMLKGMNVGESITEQRQFISDNPDEIKINLDKTADNLSTSTEVESEVGSASAGAKSNLADRIKTLHESKETLDTIKHIRKAISKSEYSGNNQSQDIYSKPVDSGYKVIANKFGKELERIRLDLDPQWIRETSSGKLNIQRAMHMDINDMDRVFDRWHEGADTCDIEAVILVDNSGSMGHETYFQAMQSAWTIKRGIEKIEGLVTLATFNEDLETIYSKNDKAKGGEYKTNNSGGGTNPFKALQMAHQILSNSTKQTKILFVVTDGVWGNMFYDDLQVKKNNLLIQQINNLGVLTSLVYFDEREYKNGDVPHYKTLDNEQFNEQYRHNCKYFNHIQNIDDLISVAKDIVKSKIKEGYRN